METARAATWEGGGCGWYDTSVKQAAHVVSWPPFCLAPRPLALSPARRRNAPLLPHEACLTACGLLPPNKLPTELMALCIVNDRAESIHTAALCCSTGCMLRLCSFRRPPVQTGSPESGDELSLTLRHSSRRCGGRLLGSPFWASPRWRSVRASPPRSPHTRPPHGVARPLAGVFETVSSWPALARPASSRDNSTRSDGRALSRSVRSLRSHRGPFQSREHLLRVRP